MTIELDDWDKEWLARQHTETEYRAEIKSALERNAVYFRRILELMDQVKSLRDQVAALRAAIDMMSEQRAECTYPDCLDTDGRCHAMFRGECAGPRA